MLITNIGIEDFIWLISIITAITITIGFIAIDNGYEIRKCKKESNKKWSNL